MTNQILLNKIMRASDEILKKSRSGSANYIIVNSSFFPPPPENKRIAKIKKIKKILKNE